MPRTNLFRALLAAIVGISLFAGCDTGTIVDAEEDVQNTREVTVVNGDVNLNSTSDPCPPAANHCRDATYSEIQAMIQDLDFTIRTDDPTCEALYESAKQFLQSGIVTVFPRNTTSNGQVLLGSYLEGAGGQEAISFNEGLWQGWPSFRPGTAIHEEAHRQGFGHPMADFYGDHCIEF